MTDPTSAAAHPTPTPGARWFVWGLLLIAVLAGGIRAVNVLVWRPTCVEDLVAAVREEGDAVEAVNRRPTPGCFIIVNDAFYGHMQGRLIAEGHGYVDPLTWTASEGAEYRNSANDAPLYALFLAAVSKVGFVTGTSHRLASGAAGVLAVVLIGLIGRRVAGPRAGLIAAFAAAIYPMLWINDGMLLVDGPAATLAAGAMWAGLRWWNRPTMARAVVFGLCLGLAGLARAEQLLQEVLVVLPLAVGIWKRRRSADLASATHAGRRVAGQVAAIWCVGLVLLAPWVAYNRDRFSEPILMTTGTGAVLSAATCDSGFYGDFLGYQPPLCLQEYIDDGYVDVYPDRTELDEAQHDKVSREAALAYISDHLDRVPIVVAARVGRMWDVYRPDQNTQANYFVEGRDKWASEAGVRMYFAMLPLGIAGGVILWRRRLPVSPFVGPAVAVTITAAISYGLTRYRVPAEVALCVLAGVAVDAMLRWRWPVDPVPLATKATRRGTVSPSGALLADPASVILPATGDEPF